jgi:hypothetical protein
LIILLVAAIMRLVELDNVPPWNARG